MPPIGTHTILEMYDCPAEVIDDLELVRQAVRDAARAARSTLLHESAHSFEPQGVTALGLLAESHISVHTWPELGYAAADVFTCGEHARPHDACESLVRSLRAGRHEIKELARGVEAPSPRPVRAPEPAPAATSSVDPRRDAG